MFVVIKAFRDAKNKEHFYDVGETYPVEGYTPTENRIKELAKGKNKYGVAFLKEIPDPVPDPGNGANTNGDQTPDPGNGAGNKQ